MSRVDNTGGSGFTVDNNNGLVVRTKLNQIIAALSTLNQGSGTPSSGLAAYTPFIDGNTLKIQNSSNDGQVSLGDVSVTNFGHAGLSAANTFTSTNIFQEDVTFDGATAGRDVVFDRSDNALEFADNASAVFGAGSDLTITHDGTDTAIQNNTGDLYINSTGGSADDIIIKSQDDIYIMPQNGQYGVSVLGAGAVELYHNNSKKLETTIGGVSLTGGAAANITSVTQSSGTVTFDFALSCHHKVTLTQNVTELAAPSNQAVGQSGSIFITQPSSGNYTVAYNAAWFFTGGTTPTLSTSSGATDRIDYIVLESNKIHCVVSLDVKTGT